MIESLSRGSVRIRYDFCDFLFVDGSEEIKVPLISGNVLLLHTIVLLEHSIIELPADVD